ncbi:Uncharacterized conserved protein [Ceraceosorus bombacis]|uniref:Uncharacterized conserved protein n=1 Tax=Ceraceosorus bombacis TaxID=401625 RepID=A0A0P1B967_9BASI|nr:Uncharacterized conserved protein [Ceraceosorus bombacis]
MDAKPKLAFSFKKTVPSIGSNGVSAFSGNGLNQASSSSSQASSKSQAPKTTPITGFGGDDSGGEDDEDVASAASGSRQSQSSSKTKRNKFGMGAVPPSKASAARQAEALQLDANINDYDGVWDAMKSAEKEKQALIDEQAKTRESKYSSAFAASATRRKIDRARAEAKKIARERDAEGAEYGDTEEFVTEAYKKQMEEIAEMEKREEEEEKRNRAAKAGGMATFQKDMLASRASAHDAAVAASLRPQEDGKDAAASRGTQETAEENASATSHRKLAEEARAKGLDTR